MRFIVLILTALVLISHVEAIAVVSDYLRDNTLELLEETSTIYTIRPQNVEKYEIRVKVTYDDTHMKAINLEEEYILEPKSDVRIDFNVTAPKYNKKDNAFRMSFTLHELSGAGGGIGFLSKINKKFNLKVIKDPNRFHISPFQVAYAIILLAIVVFLYRKSKTKPRNF